MSNPGQVSANQKASADQEVSADRISDQEKPMTESSDSEIYRHTAAVAAVKDFLAQNAAASREQRHCKACGETMQYVDAYFWLDGMNVASLIPLPFCPACDPDILTSLRRNHRAEGLDIAS